MASGNRPTRRLRRAALAALLVAVGLALAGCPDRQPPKPRTAAAAAAGDS